MWLFRFPLFFTTRNRPDRNSAIASFVVVLPALPVIATTFVPLAFRTACARSCNAFVVSATSITEPEAANRRSTIAPIAPFPNASLTNSCASNLSPRNAMKKSPGCNVRVSVTMLPISPARSPDRTSPPTASATQPRVSRRSSPNPRPEAPRHQRLARYRHVVKWQRHATDLLVLLVSLAGDQHDIACLRLGHGMKNRLPAIDNRHHLDRKSVV